MSHLVSDVQILYPGLRWTVVRLELAKSDIIKVVTRRCWWRKDQYPRLRPSGWKNKALRAKIQPSRSFQRGDSFPCRLGQGNVERSVKPLVKALMPPNLLRGKIKVRHPYVLQDSGFATPRGQFVSSVRPDQGRRTWLDWKRNSPVLARDSVDNEYILW